MEVRTEGKKWERKKHRRKDWNKRQRRKRDTRSDCALTGR